jgi:hypothetical protein
MYSSSLAEVADHEAGHIATLTEYGIEIFGAHIVPERGQDGATQCENVFWGTGGAIDRCNECFARTLRRIVILLSGPVAEASFDPGYEADFKQADYEESFALAWFHCQDGDKAGRLLAYLVSEAERIVDLRWRQVEAVARAFSNGPA